MKLTCSQIDILVSFYLENELSDCLKKHFEDHINQCKQCSAKLEMIKEVVSEIKNDALDDTSDELVESSYTTSVHKNAFKTNLSAYIDNELPSEENIKLKKLTITNKQARKELEDSYNIRRLMSDSYKKTKAEAKQDYTKSILRQLQLEDEVRKGFHPAIKFLIIITIIVLITATGVLLYINP